MMTFHSKRVPKSYNMIPGGFWSAPLWRNSPGFRTSARSSG